MKKEFCECWDKHIDNLFSKALSFYEKNSNLGINSIREKLNANFKYFEGESVSVFFTYTKSGKLAKPKKSTVKNYKSSKLLKENGIFELSCDAVISFKNKSKTISWYVDRNNHAVRDAREDPISKKLFSLLDTVKWTSRTGGEVLYSNEYMEEEGPCCPSGSNSYGYALVAKFKKMGCTQKQIKEMVKDGKEINKPSRYGAPGRISNYGGWIGRRY